METGVQLPPDRPYKVVRAAKDNTDEYLVCFAPDKEAALLKALDLRRGNADGLYLAKPTDPARIESPKFTDYCHYVRALIPDAEFDRVIASDAEAEISANVLMCDAMAYYELSRIIPKDFTVIDIGCAYNAQSYLFAGHKCHIAVNPKLDVDGFRFEDFRAPNTKHYEMSGQDFICDVLPTLGLDLAKTFAICTHVQDTFCQDMVRQVFPNLYVFYPKA